MGDGGSGVANGSGSVALLESAPQEQELATPSEPAVGTCIVVIQRYRLFKQRHGLGSRLRHQDVHIGNGAQNEVVGVEIVWPFAFDTLNLCIAQTRLNCTDRVQSDFVLESKNIA